ncbi:MAG: NADH-quinone oxidoreductase subunit L [Acidimicrobiia bacterium]|nr:NADH-quinone oxidoreductase subunit L [Acidimicrobiia bacterium]
MIGALTTGWFLENAWLIPVIPGLAFFVILLVGKRLPLGGAEVGIASMAAALVLAVGASLQWIQRTDSLAGTEEAGPLRVLVGFARSIAASEGGDAEPYVAPVIRKWVWWQNSGFEFGLGQHIDGLAVMMLFLVAFISLLVQIYSIEYVRGDRRFTHFFAALTLFSAGMLVMVLAENMVQLILGWEIMGLCSFLLIGHWWEDEANARAAMKAFLTVRVGDIGLLVGTAILFFGANQWAQDNADSDGFSIQAISGWALSGEASDQVLLWGAVALFAACIGKSGQFPLHTWLPDAMAGPTPVSSLLHSSTMVVAGVFLVARLYPVFWEAFSIPDVSLNLIVVIAAITIVISGLLAFVQDDIKKVLAYSTVGQLGYMMLGLGAGAWLPAVFHIFTHAFFKCCLFLCAGSVSHSGSHHSFDMRKDMGGLAKKMPITAGAWIASSLALAGVFPFAGFFSKDEIIDNVGHNGYTTFMWIALGSAFITAAYTVRATYLTFFGEPRGAAAGVHHDDHDTHDEPPLDIGQVTPELALATAAAGHPVAGHEVVTSRHSGDARDVDSEPALHVADELAEGHDGHVADGSSDDHHDSHASHGPHESPKLILVPVVILAFLAVTAGFVNAVPFGEDFEQFKEYVEPRPEAVEATAGQPEATPAEDAAAAGLLRAPGGQVTTEEGEEGAAGEESHATGCGHEAPAEGACFFPTIDHAEFKWSKAALSLGIVFAGIVSSWVVCVALYTKRDRRLVGLTQRFAPARIGYAFLANKYYLDVLYENVIIRGIAHPIARAGYWVNQHIIDGLVNGAAAGGRRAGGWFYRNIDQRVVDGAVNGSGTVATGTGTALQPVQSGKVNQYGALLFGAAAIAAVVLVLVNV